MKDLAKLLNQVSKLFVTLCIFIISSFANGETDQAYIAKNAINAYGTILAKELVDQLSKYQVIMMGEVHGTSEYPLFVLDLLRNLKAAGKKVTLALEIPANFQAIIDHSISKKDLSILANSDFFQSKFQDGRQSLAMALLIMIASADANIFCFDTDWPVNAKNRDLDMAKNVTKYAKNNPDTTLVLL